jgi:hypothetical protein
VNVPRLATVLSNGSIWGKKTVLNTSAEAVA